MVGRRRLICPSCPDPNAQLVHLGSQGFSPAGSERVLPLDAMASELEGLSGEYAAAPLAITEHLLRAGAHVAPPTTAPR